MSIVSNPRVGFPNWLPRWKSKHLKVRGTRYRSHSLFSFLYLSCPQNMASPIWKSHYWEERLYKHCLKNGTCLLFLENISLEEIKFIRGQSYKSKIIWSLNLRGPWLEFGTVPPPSFPLYPVGHQSCTWPWEAQREPEFTRLRKVSVMIFIQSRGESIDIY